VAIRRAPAGLRPGPATRTALPYRGTGRERRLPWGPGL